MVEYLKRGGLRAAAITGLAGLALAGCETTSVATPAPTEPTAASVIADSLGRAQPTAAAPAVEATPQAIAALVSADPVDVTLPPQPLPQMLDTVFGGILGLPYALGPNVGARQDIVTLRTGRGLTKRELFRQVQTTLDGYGLKVRIQAGTVQVVEAAAPTGALTLNARGQSATPEATRTISQVHRVRAVSPDALTALMTDVFPSGGLSFAADTVSDSVTVSGSPRDVAQAVGILNALDQPRFAGVSVVRAQPVYWSAESLAASLRDSLASEGYRISDSPASARSVFVLAAPGANQVLVFAGDPTALQSARTWITRLDRPDALGGRTTTFLYQVRNTDAGTLAELITASRGKPDALAAPLQAGLPGQPPLDPAMANEARPVATGSFGEGRLAVDESGNRIIFTGTAEDFTDLRGLLTALDTPRPQVLVEVTVAEVTLTDETRAGLEWFFNNSMSDGVLSGGTKGGLELGGGGLTLNYNGLPDLQIAFNAFASNNKVNILSRPRLVARSGDEAKIQVGTDVPIITSRANSSTSTGGNTDILQTIQYRQTGVILTIKPIIFSDGRIDLQITQEVSSQQPNANATIASPLILNRSVTTRLSLDEGATAVIGGLIDDSYSKTNNGIPFLKDIPILGLPFRVDSISGGKTELVILVTPHILRDGGEMAFWTQKASGELNAAFAVGRGWSYTLTPFSRRDMRLDPIAPAAPR